MVSCEALVRQLHTGSPSKQRHAVVALLGMPMTPRNWLSALGAVPRLVQLLDSASTSAPQVMNVRHLLHHISGNYEGAGDNAVPDGVIPRPLVPLLRHDEALVCSVAATTLASLATTASNQHQIIEAGAIVPLIQLMKCSSEAVLHFPAVQALACLSHASHSARAKIVAAGAIPPLLPLLKSSAVQVQLPAVTLARILAVDYTDQAAAAGAGPLLVQLLTSSSAGVQAEAAQALIILASNADTIAPAAVSAGAVPLLLGLLRTSGASAGKLQQLAVSTLFQLSLGAQGDVIAAGAIEALVSLLKTDTESAALLNTVLALFALSSENEVGQDRLAGAGAIAPLVQVLQAASSDEELRTHAVMLVSNLAVRHAKEVVKAGAVPLLVQRLTGGATDAQEQAAYTLEIIAADFDTHAEILAAAPLLPLVYLLSSSSEEAQDNAHRVLSHLSISPAFARRVAAAGAIPSFVHMLRYGSALVQLRAVKFLCLLLFEAEGRSEISAQIKSAGALPLLAHLQTAASSAELRSDAKRVLQALTNGTSPLDGMENVFLSALLGSIATSDSHAPAAASSSTAPAALSPVASAEQQLPPRPRKSCWSCGAMGVSLKLCSKCSVAAYCGAACQKMDWKAHKGQCAGLKAGTASASAKES